MASLKHKKALLIGAFFALTALLAPGLIKVCQAATQRAQVAHGCCQEKSKCGAHLNSQCCCQSSAPTSRSSVPVSQANPDTAKIFPLISYLIPNLQIGEGSLNYSTATIAFHAPPPFLAHHAFLC